MLDSAGSSPVPPRRLAATYNGGSSSCPNKANSGVIRQMPPKVQYEWSRDFLQFDSNAPRRFQSLRRRSACITYTAQLKRNGAGLEPRVVASEHLALRSSRAAGTGVIHISGAKVVGEPRSRRPCDGSIHRTADFGSMLNFDEGEVSTGLDGSATIELPTDSSTVTIQAPGYEAITTTLSRSGSPDWQVALRVPTSYAADW